MTRSTSRLNQFCSIAVTAAVLSLLGPQARAELSGPVPVAQLAAGADTILTGTVITGRQSQGISYLTVQTERIIKGTTAAGGVVSLFWESTRQGSLPDIDVGGVHGLFFAQTSAGNRLTILSATVNPLDVRDTFFRLPPSASMLIPYSPNDSVLSKLLRELLPAESYRRVTPGRSAEFNVVDNAAVGPPDSAALVETAQALLSSTAAADQVVGLQALLVQGNVLALATLEANQKLLATPSGAGLAETLKQYYRNPDATGIALLGRISQTSGNPSFANAALASLAMIHSRDALPYLVKFLDSTEPALLKYAVGGLAMYANNVPIGSFQPSSGPAPFRNADTIAHSAMDAAAIVKRPLYYSAFWKQWWSEHSAELGR
jgi:hypothetical protein